MNDNKTNPSSEPVAGKVDSSRVILWASAFILGALVITQAGRLPGNPAYADSVSNGAKYTLLTASTGRGGDADEGPQEYLVVIDSDAGVLMAYETDTRNGITPRDGGSLPALFFQAHNR